LGLDAILIADSGEDSLSGTNPLRLGLDGRTAFIQVVLNYLENQAQVVPPIDGDGTMSWSSAPKLNGIFLLSYVTKHNFNVELIDRYYDERDHFSSLLQQTPRVAIISTTFVYSKQALRSLVNDIRSQAPDIFIIVGGPFIYLSYLMLQRSHEEHYETEPERIRENRSLDTLPNSARLVGKAYSFTNRVDDISNAGDIVVDWQSLPDKIFQTGVVTMQASNGCPYRCAFCNFTKDRRLMFMKPIDQLVSELKAVSGRGVRYVWFSDDNFRLGKGDLTSICQRLADEDLPVQWMSFIRASTLRNVDGGLLRRSGCIEVQLGLESADPQVLHNMNKKASTQLYHDVVRKVLAAGVNCSCYFIFGFPGETDETALRTREFIRSIEFPELEGILTWSMFPFILSPMSPIYEFEMRKKYGLTGYMQNWKHDTMDSSQPLEQIKKAFLELENSGPISRGDNLDIFFSLTPHQRKKFIALRHKLSKLGLKSQLKKHHIIESFTKLLQ